MFKGGKKQGINLASGLEENRPPRKKNQDKKRAKSPAPGVGKENSRLISMEIEKSKQAVMWAGISFFMLLLFIFWAFNATQTIKSAIVHTAGTENAFEGIDNELESKFKELQESLKAISEFAGSSASSSLTGITPASTQESAVGTGTLESETAAELPGTSSKQAVPGIDRIINE